MSVQLNVRTTPVLVDEVDKVVEKGYFRNRTEAVNEALRLLIRRYQLMRLEERMNKVGERTRELPSVTDAVVNSHREED
ncbi:MAG: ribbon-helix-helix domain-containing protein [Candidatus Altiarchaeota archaeon]